VLMYQCLCNDCRFCADMVVETQIDRHLDLVTATLARPDMTDFSADPNSEALMTLSMAALFPLGGLVQAQGRKKASPMPTEDG
jgi:hypothetical protein